MKLVIEPTSQLGTTTKGSAVRLWSGKTDTGIPVFCWIALVGVPDDAGEAAHKQFESELIAVPDVVLEPTGPGTVR